MKRLTTLIAGLILGGLVLAAGLEGQVPDLLYLPFNEGSGSSTADGALPGLGLAPTLVGQAGWDATPMLGASALLMPAGVTSGDQVQTNQPFALSGSWTLEFWFRNDDAASTTRYILGDASAGSFRCYKSGASPASVILAGTGVSSLTLTAAAPLGQWVHVAFVYDDLGLELNGYVDGVFAGMKKQAANLAFSGTAASGLLIGGYSTSSRMIGGLDELRLYSWARSADEIDRERSLELSGQVADLGIVALQAPVDSTGCDPLGAAESIVMLVRNVGSSTLAAGTPIVASYAIDGAAPVVETFTLPGAVALSDTLPLTFALGGDLSAAGPHTIVLGCATGGDLNGVNDVLTASVRSGGDLTIASFPWLENFDASAAINTTQPPPGWKQDQNDASGTDSDWYFRSGATASANTGPTSDYSSGAGFYAYVEDSTGNFAQVNLITPCLDLGPLAHPRLQFALHSMNGSTSGPTVNENFLSVDLIVYPGGLVTADALGPIGDLGASWSLQALDLAAFAGQTIQLVFRGRSDGGSFTHDIAIDDVGVFEGQVSIGQAPRAGLAVFDLNGALSPNQGPVASGDQGPYQALATAGGPFLLGFEGEPGQPILLLFGAANPRAATYPGGIGQFDIGGAVDAFGIPLGLQVVADGFRPWHLLWAIFNTGPSGSLALSFSAPPLPPGPHGALQAVLGTSQPFAVALSNSVEMTFF
ncbi:MAG: hypothetical protein H6807_15545 [Planctomycetes bacterium]|nr:hypothetical protein [Planctomycetota bacterium]